MSEPFSTCWPITVASPPMLTLIWSRYAGVVGRMYVFGFQFGLRTSVSDLPVW